MSALLHAALLMEEAQNNAKIRDDILQATPKNTGRALHPKQKEFINLTKQKGYENPEIDTEEKVALFLSWQGNCMSMHYCID